MNAERYHRQMLLPGVGEAGQARLRASAALVVGCGALGTHLADLLTRAGVGELIVVDRDFVEATNLQRQVLFDESDVAASLPKAEAARRKLERVNSDVRLTAVVDDVNHENVERFAFTATGRPVDVIVDGLDNFETRFLLNDLAVKHAIPYVYGGAVATTGMTYAMLPRTAAGDSAWEAATGGTPCLRCIFGSAPPAGTGPTCDTVGVLASVVSIVASYQFNEAFKILTGNWAAICPHLQHIDAWHNTFRQLSVHPSQAPQGDEAPHDCPCCDHRRFEFLDGKLASTTATLCGRDAVQLRQPGQPHPLDLETLADRLRQHSPTSVNEFMLRTEVSDNGQTYELTVFRNGRAIVKGTPAPDRARAIYAKYVGA